MRGIAFLLVTHVGVRYYNTIQTTSITPQASPAVAYTYEYVKCGHLLLGILVELRLVCPKARCTRSVMVR